jgi:GTP cyclohydrolase II
MRKLQACSLQDPGLDTVEANHALGSDADCRDFSLAVAILENLGVARVHLLTRVAGSSGQSRHGAQNLPNDVRRLA